MADIGAFDILNNISVGMEDVLTQFVTTPVDILTAGVLMVAYPAMCMWFMYVHVYICGIYPCVICVFHVGVRSRENRGEVSPHL